MIDTILEGAARAIFVQWWANQCSCGRDWQTCELEGDGDPSWSADETHRENAQGGELMSYAPETPRGARECATAMVTKIIRHNGLDPWGKVCRRPEVQGDLNGFGHYLSMEALGHGVQWSDSHEDHGLKLPDLDYQGDHWSA